MNSRQRRREAHKVKMRDQRIRKFGKRVSFNIMRDSPFQKRLRGLSAGVDEGRRSWTGFSIMEDFSYGS